MSEKTAELDAEVLDLLRDLMHRAARKGRFDEAELVDLAHRIATTATITEGGA